MASGAGSSSPVRTSGETARQAMCGGDQEVTAAAGRVATLIDNSARSFLFARAARAQPLGDHGVQRALEQLMHQPAV